MDENVHYSYGYGENYTNWLVSWVLDMSLDLLRQRVPATMCARCRKDFSPGDRIVTVCIVVGKGRNPSTKNIETMLSDEFELAHADCIDTSLSGKLIT